MTRKHSSCETFRLTSNSLNVIPTFVQVVLSVSFTYSHPASVDQIGGGGRHTEAAAAAACGIRMAGGGGISGIYSYVRALTSNSSSFLAR